MAEQKKDPAAAPFPTSVDDWRAGHAKAALDAFYARTVGAAEERIAWYDRKAGRAGAWSQWIRRAAIVVGTVGTLVPLVGVAVDGDDLANWGYIFLGLAAALLAADSAFGHSSSWMRFRTTEIEMRRLLANFRFDWALELARLDGKELGPVEVENLLKVQRGFADAIEAAAEAETATWVQEFRSSLTELARTYKAAAEGRQPGAIDVRVTNAARAEGKVEVAIDRRPAGALVGENYQINEVPPGLHAVQVRGTIDGRETGASGAVAVKAGEIAQIELTLVEPAGG